MILIKVFFNCKAQRKKIHKALVYAQNLLVGCLAFIDGLGTWDLLTLKGSYNYTVKHEISRLMMADITEGSGSVYSYENMSQAAVMF